MNKYFFAVVLMLSTVSLSFAGVNMKPGLWVVKTTMKNAPGGVGAEGMSMKVCYTAEMIEHPESIAKNHQGSSHCTTKMASQTPSKMTVSFQCENGSKGSGEWNFASQDQYTGLMQITDSKGKSFSISHSAKFLVDDCGSVKPFVAPAR